jgi:predicted dehydrogenase
MSEVLRVGMVGYAFMGAAHAQAWRNAHRFFDLPLTPELTSVAGRSPEAVSAAAERLGFASIETEWRRLVERTDIDLIDICTPGDSHAEIAIAALQTGKHTVEEAEQMAAAASSAAERGVWAHVALRTAVRRHWPWHASWSRRAGSAPSARCEPSTCKTGCAIPTPR